jgi:hypothetical protein
MLFPTWLDSCVRSNDTSACSHLLIFLSFTDTYSRKCYHLVIRVTRSRVSANHRIEWHIGMLSSCESCAFEWHIAMLHDWNARPLTRLMRRPSTEPGHNPHTIILRFRHESHRHTIIILSHWFRQTHRLRSNDWHIAMFNSMLHGWAGTHAHFSRLAVPSTHAHFTRLAVPITHAHFTRLAVPSLKSAPRNLPLPNEDFGRLDKHFRVRFRSTFQGCEYSIWATQRWKMLRKRTLKCLSGLPKSSFGEHKFQGTLLNDETDHARVLQFG